MSEILDLVLWLRNHSVVPMLLVFLLIVISAYAPAARRKMQQHAEIPLRDDRRGV
jgi:cbb3-type cytochrome oxidase subunit 3